MLLLTSDAGGDAAGPEPRSRSGVTPLLDSAQTELFHGLDLGH